MIGNKIAKFYDFLSFILKFIDYNRRHKNLKRRKNETNKN